MPDGLAAGDPILNMKRARGRIIQVHHEGTRFPAVRILYEDGQCDWVDGESGQKYQQAAKETPPCPQD